MLEWIAERAHDHCVVDGIAEELISLGHATDETQRPRVRDVKSRFVS